MKASGSAGGTGNRAPEVAENREPQPRLNQRRADSPGAERIRGKVLFPGRPSTSRLRQVGFRVYAQGLPGASIDTNPKSLRQHPQLL